MKLNRILGALIGTLALSGLTAQTVPVPTAGTNWIMTQTATDQGKAIDIVYYNGLGLPIQNVSVKNTRNGKDLVLPIEYDGVLRDDARSYLPYPAETGDGAYRNNALASQAQYYQNTFGSEGARAYSTKDYQASPLNRVRRTAGPGVLTADGSIKYVTHTYESNGSGEVLKLEVNESSNVLTIVGYYSGGTLFRTKSVDEDGRTTAVYTNQEGQTLLTRAYDNDGSSVDTYSVYDNAGRLRWMISPEGAAGLGTSGTLSPTDTRAKEYCYIYSYDERGNVIEKYLPGREPEYLVYDPVDRLVMSQDGNQRADGNRWLLIRYDAHDRMVSQQTLPDSRSRQTLSGLFAAGQEASLYDSSTALLEAEYSYDSDQVPAHLEYMSPHGEIAGPYDQNRNRLLYEKVRVLDAAGDNYIERAFYYTPEGWLIQTLSLDQFGDYGRVTNGYYSDGTLYERMESHGKDEFNPEVVLNRIFTYDSRNRLIKEAARFNDDPEIAVIYTYDELGNLEYRINGSGYESAGEWMDYNIRGWLTRKGDLRLYYNSPQHPETQPSYAGNITEWEWARDAYSDVNTYSFSYDGLSRLTDTKQYINGVANDQNVEKGLTYDKNGNLKTLQRYSAGALSDNFTYNYMGNRLTSLSGSSSGAYTYDANGNTLHDGLHNLDLTYNRLNLLEKVSQNGSTLANYVYLSDGTKVSATNASGDGLVYLGSFTYKKNGANLAFESAPFGEGRFVATATGFEPHYFLRDHLGSVRAVVADNGEVLERNDYYPFGTRWNGGQLSDSRYRYNGKEEQGFLNLPYLDYGARMYDSRRGGWLTQDPLRQFSSGYVFNGNNPVNFVDRDGRWSVSNHHKMTMRGLAKYGIQGNQAFLLAYYASVYADNPGKDMIYNNLAHPKYMMGYLSNVDHSGTADSQKTAWQLGDSGMNNNIRHSMRSNWEAEAFEAGISGGISKRAAQLRGMQYGWDNIFSSAAQGKLKDFKINSSAMQQFGVGLHALQDGYGHAGISMREHRAYYVNDVFGDLATSQIVTDSAIFVHRLLSGDWTGLSTKIDIDLTGMSDAQKSSVLEALFKYCTPK